jgi:hypothetical protein
MNYGIIAIALLVVFYFRYHKVRKRSQELLTAFKNDQDFLGKDIQYIVNKVGPYTAYGSMDHGDEMAQWKSGSTCIEVFFENGLCVSINDK